jgi:hypothetical protein
MNSTQLDMFGPPAALVPVAVSRWIQELKLAKRQEIEAHKERLEWLSEDCPRWSCGTPVDLPIKLRMIDQSKQILASNGIQL